MKKPKNCISIENARKEQNEWVRTRGKDICESKSTNTDSDLNNYEIEPMNIIKSGMPPINY